MPWLNTPPCLPLCSLLPLCSCSHHKEHPSPLLKIQEAGGLHFSFSLAVSILPLLLPYQPHASHVRDLAYSSWWEHPCNPGQLEERVGTCSKTSYTGILHQSSSCIRSSISYCRCHADETEQGIAGDPRRWWEQGDLWRKTAEEIKHKSMWPSTFFVCLFPAQPSHDHPRLTALCH